ncbi:hypothetical protein [Sphingobacterium puteale]|uniref:hypothetical protein n=1 Tax=Sphingobacterium puteale TaxID=2420510 RepID=UPI003D98A047
MQITNASYYLFMFLLVLITSRTLSQVNKNVQGSSALFPKNYGQFENYKFILNGEIIKHEDLVNYPGAVLDRSFPYSTTAKSKYQGVVYFHTPWYPPSPSDKYAEDPAYFINNVQVNPYTIRSSKAEYYKQIRRSAQDTLIDGIRYKGSIHVDTDEDFFADRIALPELIRRYTGLPMEQVIVHWHGKYLNQLNPGVTIHHNFKLYYVDPRGLGQIKVDRVRFAEGERYFVNLVDQGYPFSYFTEKGWRSPQHTYLVFNEPRVFDPDAPCYLADFDTIGKKIYHRAKEEPRPLGGEEVYLKKLSTIMGLFNGKLKGTTHLDSMMVQFIVLGNGQITGLESVGLQQPDHINMLKAIKQHSCVWPVVWEDRRVLLFRRKMIIFFHRDKKGKMKSLDRLEYRHDRNY